jgi:hypothetical protein
MRVAIHQPEYWPLPRLLAKWAQSDVLILLDTVQFDRASLQHRCRLASPDGQLRWLTIPFRHELPLPRLRSLEPASTEWPVQHERRLLEWYRHSDPIRMQEVHRWFQTMRRTPDHSVAQYAADSLLWCGHQIQLTTPTLWASALFPPEGGWRSKADLVLDLCKTVGATTYVSGVSGATYLERAGFAFQEAGIDVEVQAFSMAREYTRQGKELSALHVYLTDGPEALRELIYRADRASV